MRLIVFFSAALIVSPLVHSDALLEYVEYKIPTYNLLAFSSQGVTLRSCEDCNPEKFRIDSKTQFHNKNLPVDLKEATSIYVSKTYPEISVFINRITGVVDIVRFGVFDETLMNPNPEMIAR
jgi:hypothetical protein